MSGRLHDHDPGGCTCGCPVAGCVACDGTVSPGSAARIATVIEGATERYKTASSEMDRLTSAPGGPGAAWRWSIPARPDRDTDLILDASVTDVPKLLGVIAEQAAEISGLREDVTESKSADARTWTSNLLWQEEAERLREAIIELNRRLDAPIRPYADRRIPMSTEREFLREAYGDSLVDDLEAILAKAVQS